MIDGLSNSFDATLRNVGYLLILGQFLSAKLVTAIKWRHTNGERADFRAGCMLKYWQDKPALLPIRIVRRVGR